MEQNSALKFSKDHHWLRFSDAGAVCRIGLTDCILERVGVRLLCLELPRVGQAVERDTCYGVLETATGVLDLVAPVSGVVQAANRDAAMDPTLVTRSPYGDGWLIEIRADRPGEDDFLLDAGEYDRRFRSA